MKTFKKRQESCDDCYLSTYAPYGGCMCTTLWGKSLFECPGAITDKIVREAQAAVLKAQPAVGPEQLTKTKAENGVAKMKVRIAMNLDLIAEYFSLVNDFLAKEKEMDGFSADYCRLTKLLREMFPAGYHPADVQLDAIFSAGFAQAKEQWETAAEKKSALEAKIMEKLMAE